MVVTRVVVAGARVVAGAAVVCDGVAVGVSPVVHPATIPMTTTTITTSAMMRNASLAVAPAKASRLASAAVAVGFATPQWGQVLARAATGWPQSRQSLSMVAPFGQSGVVAN